MKIILLSLFALQASQAGAVAVANPHHRVYSQEDMNSIVSLFREGVPGPAPAFPVAGPAPGPAAQDSDDDDTVCTAEEEHEAKVVQELAANVREQASIKKTLKDLSNKTKSDMEIKTYAEQVAKQTESKALGNMLEKMWKDQRMFEYHDYVEYANKELKDLQREETRLAAELKSAKSALEACRDGEKGVAIGGDSGEGKEEEEDKEGKSKEDSDSIQDNIERDFAKIVDDVDDVDASANWNVNVWKMKAKERTEAFFGSFIYLLCGILVAFLYKQASSRHPKHFLPEVRRDTLPNERNFSFGLFDCFAAPKLCILGCFCPCLMWADTLDRKKLLSYWVAFLAFFGLLWLHIYTGGISTLCIVILGVVYRQKLRGIYKINNRTAGTVGMDILVWTFCQPCAIIQEAREDSVVRNDESIIP